MRRVVSTRGGAGWFNSRFRADSDRGRLTVSHAGLRQQNCVAPRRGRRPPRCRQVFGGAGRRCKCRRSVARHTFEGRRGRRAHGDGRVLCGNRHAVVLTSHRWRGGHDSAAAETRRDNLISTQVAFLKRVGAVNRRSASSLIDTPDSLSQVSLSRSRSSLTASPSPSSSSIRRSLSFSTIRSPKIAPAPQTGGLVIRPPARGSRDRDPMNVSMDRSNGSCAVS